MPSKSLDDIKNMSKQQFKTISKIEQKYIALKYLVEQQGSKDSDIKY